MSVDATSLLREALGVRRSIRLAVSSERHPKPDYVDIDSTYALIGRGSGCHVVLPGKKVSYRHVYLQAFGDRVLCVDLLSATGIEWDGPDLNGWLTPGHRVGIAGSRLQLMDDGWVSKGESWPSPLECKTRDHFIHVFGELPDVHLQLDNRKLKGISWPINRVMTLVGRDNRCRITCGDGRISRVHCSLVLSPAGLWVIDLLGRGGISVNDRQESVALLQDGDTLGVGQYRMTTVYESASVTAGPQSTSGPPDTAEFPAVDNSLAGAAEALPVPEFLTRNNRVFPVTYDGDTVIVSPRGGIRTAPYQQIQLESNIITQLLATRPALKNVVIDGGAADAMDSIIISSVSSICRAAKKKAALCNCSAPMLEVLNDMSLTKVWRYFGTMDEALTYVKE